MFFHMCAAAATRMAEHFELKTIKIPVMYTLRTDLEQSTHARHDQQTQRTHYKLSTHVHPPHRHIRLYSQLVAFRLT